MLLTRSLQGKNLFSAKSSSLQKVFCSLDVEMLIARFILQRVTEMLPITRQTENMWWGFILNALFVLLDLRVTPNELNMNQVHIMLHDTSKRSYILWNRFLRLGNGNHIKLQTFVFVSFSVSPTAPRSVSCHVSAPCCSFFFLNHVKLDSRGKSLAFHFLSVDCPDYAQLCLFSHFSTLPQSALYKRIPPPPPRNASEIHVSGSLVSSR